MDKNDLTHIFREVADEMAAEGRPLPVPPDQEDEEVDREFWTRVDRRLSADSEAERPE